VGQISVLSFSKHQNPSWEVREFLGQSRNSLQFTEPAVLLPWSLKSCRWTCSSDVFEGSLYLRLQHPLATWIFMSTAVCTSHLAFLTVFTRARPLSVSWTTLIQYISSNSIYLRSTLMLSSLLCLHLHILSFLRFQPTKHVMHFSFPRTWHMHLPSYLPLYDQPSNIWPGIPH